MKIRLLFSLFVLVLMMVNAKAQITTVGLIGTATPDGWNSDIDMVQDPDSTNLWSLETDLVAGEAKFRADDAWTLNWGNNTFPTGIGFQEGPNVPVPGGHYLITFNSNTGAYFFNVVPSDIGILGSATPFGWEQDINLTQDEVDTNQYSIVLGLVIGEAKFRQNDDWAVNWGSADFPSGIGTQNGLNVPIPLGGDYVITFNKSTGAYNFLLATFSNVGLIGDATSGGWDTPTPLTQDPGNARQWNATVTLGDGGLQFSGDEGSVIWGGTDFPSGTAVADGDTIPVPAGKYIVNFNSVTLAYEFIPIQIFDVVGLVGDATPGGWDADTDMERGADSSEWSLRVVLTDGLAKFRANHDWVVNWGSGDFPSGTGVQDGPEIPVTGGEYRVTFNSFTGVYNFVQIIVPDRVGLVGAGTPIMSWDIDYFFNQSATDENVWTLNQINLDGNVKIRADSSWTINWGAVDFPTGIGTQDGPNIPVPAGTYGITFNSNTGEYIFSDPLTSTKDILDPSSISAYPNPAKDVLNIDLSAVNMQGKVHFNVFDMNGKLVLTDAQEANTIMKLGVASLPNGYYTMQITNDKYIIGKKFVILK